MAEEYLLAWNEHHSTFFSSMAELIAGDVLTDVTIWAGQTMYSAHRLVLALSSSYFRVVVTGTAQEGKLPVIFLKDVSSKDFERLLSYMYHGEVSVPQSELLSLIAAAKSLGIRGLVEDVGTEGDDTDDAQDKKEKEIKLPEKRGEKREGDFCDSQKLFSKKNKQSFHSSQPNLTHKSWHTSETFKKTAVTTNKQEPSEEMIPLRAQEKVAAPESDEAKIGDEKKDSESKSKDKEDTDKETRIGTKNLTNFFEVNVKQEEEENPGEDPSLTESPGDYLTPHPLSLVRRSLLPSLLPSSPHNLPERRSSALLAHTSNPVLGTITRNTGTCHFCGRSFMKNKQLMNHVCPMRHAGK